MKIKFIQMNTWGNGGIFEKALDFLVQERPDIACLQEVHDGHDPSFDLGFRGLDLLKANLDLPNYHYAPAFYEKRYYNQKIIQGTAIFSRWPIMNSKVTFINRAFEDFDGLEGPKDFFNLPRAIQEVKIQAEDKILNVFNTHGIWGEDGKDNPERLKFSQAVIDQVRGKDKIILSGDFNVNEGTRSISMIDEVLNNVFKEDKRKSSFNMKRKTDPGYGTAVVDFIFTSHDIKVLSHKMPQVDVTDHLPLIAELEI